MNNTCVNFTYHFLAQKFYVFREFLFDPYINSYLSAERRWFRRTTQHAQYARQKAQQDAGAYTTSGPPPPRNTARRGTRSR